MIGYLLLGTNDLPKAIDFYDKLLSGIGAARAMEAERMTLWSTGKGGTLLGICTPADENTATHGNGTMVAIPAGSKDNVDDMRVLAESLNAPYVSEITDNAEMGFYAVYIRDLDQNKLCFYHM